MNKLHICHTCAFADKHVTCSVTNQDVAVQATLGCPLGLHDDPPSAGWPAEKLLTLLGERQLPATWAKFSVIQQHYRDKMAIAAANIPPYPAKKRGRGIIICGLGSYFASAYVSIRMTRHLGDNDPIELWALPGEELELWQRKAIQNLGVTVRWPAGDFRASAHPGWQIKAYAIVNSEFKDIRLSDADSYPVISPDVFWESPQWKQFGAIYFPDALGRAGHNLKAETWTLFGLEPHIENDAESGQLFIDTFRHWRTMHICNWINQNSDYYYSVSPGDAYGDKYTFILAHRYLKDDFYMTPDLTYRDPTFLQKAPDGQIAIVHRVNGKFSLQPELKEFANTVQRQPEHRRNDNVPMEAVAWNFLKELKRIATATGWQPKAVVETPVPPVIELKAKPCGGCGGKKTAEEKAAVIKERLAKLR